MPACLHLYIYVLFTAASGFSIDVEEFLTFVTALKKTFMRPLCRYVRNKLNQKLSYGTDLDET
jgi:hypothetical protein